MSITTIRSYKHWEDTDFLRLARHLLAGSRITQATISSIGRKVFDANGDVVEAGTASLVVADVVYDTLQTDDQWDRDETGYNFRDSIPATVWATPGTYRVEYLFTGSGGQKFIDVFQVVVQGILTS